MQFSRFFVDRPIFTIMIMLIIIILGAISVTRLPIDLLPDISYPTLSVSCSYGNVAPQEIEQLITRPLEETLSAIAGVEEVSSTSSQGRSNIRLSFAWGTNLEEASNDIRERLDRVVSRLPDGADRPSLRKFDAAAMPIMTLGATGNLDPIELRNIIDDQAKNRIERIPGVASLDISGGLQREIHVTLRPEDLQTLGLSLDQVASAIRSANQSAPGGTVTEGNLEVTVRTPGEYTNLDELRNTIVATRQNAPIRLKDIATIEDATPRVSNIIRINGKPGVYVSVSKQSGTNTVQVARSVKREIEAINKDVPYLQLIPINDSSIYIERSINNVLESAMYGGLLTILVLFFFLRNIPSTLIISTAIPLSIIATFVLMYFGGFTLNILTLGGLALGIGMMVDNAIVVLENISRFREEGMDSHQAAIDATHEVTAAIIAGTLTTIVVFLPMIFMRGMSGVMFKELAYVISFALLCSLGVALTLVPMLSARLHTFVMVENGDMAHHRIYRVSERMLRGLEAGYANLLDACLNQRWLVIVVCVLLIAGSIVLIPLVGSELMPTGDEGEVSVTVQTEPGTRLEVFDEMMQPIEAQTVQNVPEIDRWLATLGGSWGGSRNGNIRMTLVPAKERTRSSEQIAATVRQQLANIPGVQIRTRAGQGMFMMGMGGGGGERIQLDIQGYDLKTADALAQQVRTVAATVAGVTDVRVSRDSGNPEKVVQIDRLKAADLKLNVAQIASLVRTALQGTTASNFRAQGDEFPIIVQLRNADKMRLEDLLDLTVTNSAGQPVVLRNVAQIASQTGPSNIERKNQERIISVSVNISGREMSAVVEDLRQQLRAIPVPRNFSIVFGGEAEEQRKAFQELLVSLILALLLVYMVMACLYESLRDPLVVMFSVPLAIIGVVLMLFLTRTTFNIQSYIGCIMLAGIVVNNAILLVDHINQLRRQAGMPLRQAIEEAGQHRLRPILMTSLTTILALLPLAIGIGEGSEAQAPLARAVIGGLTSSTLITLIFVPVIYSVFESRLRGKKATIQS